MILHKETREALDIHLTDNIVIFDEAHNLIETINNIYSVEIDVLKVSNGPVTHDHVIHLFIYLDITSARAIVSIFGAVFETTESEERFVH